MMAQEAAKIAEDTRKRMEEEKKREQEQARVLAEASKKEMDVQTSIDFSSRTSTDAEEDAISAEQRVTKQLLRGLGLREGERMTEDELMKRAEERVAADKEAQMPSKSDLKQDLEREMRARLEKKKQATQA